MPLLKPAEPMPSARLKRPRMFSAAMWVSGDPNPIAHFAKHDPRRETSRAGRARTAC